MKKLKQLLLGLALLGLCTSQAQVQSKEHVVKPYIEVNGVAEKKIVPNEIYISICLEDQIKDKRFLEEQEKDLKTAIQSLGIPLKQLSLSDVNADYVRVNWRKKDVLNKAEYTLKVTDANQLGKVFKLLDEIKINGAYISKVDHSKMTDFKKEVRINAIKAAKEKATYLLAAIEEQLGKPMIVRENTSSLFANGHNVSGNYVANTRKKSYQSDFYRETGLQFEKITLRSSIYIKFEIE